MSLVFSLNLLTQMAISLIDTCGTSPLLILYEGSVPQSCEVVVQDTPVATFTLPMPFLENSVGNISLASPWVTMAEITATAGYFRFIDQNNNVIFQGTVGTAYSSVWQTSTTYATGALVLNGLNVYIANNGGVSLSGGAGPLGQTNGIVDNNITWNFVGAVGDLNFVSPNFTLGQTITISNFNINLGNGPS